MAEAMSTAGNMEMSLKDSGGGGGGGGAGGGGGLIVDMSPSAMLQQQQLAAAAQQALRGLKECAGAVNLDASAVDAASNNNNNHSNSNSGHALGGASSLAGIGATNLTTTPSPPMTTFRCERCDNFETSSRASLLLHVVQCLSSPARLKAEDGDHDGLSVTAMHHGDGGGAAGAGGLTSSLGGKLLPASGAADASSGLTSTVAASSPAASSSSSSSSSRKVFECDVCNMKFSNGANMRRHKMRHTGVKPYECRVCQKRFFRKDHLAEHFTTHTKTLPYHCPICNRGFQRQIAMRAHFQNEHVGQHDLVKTCPLCSYRAGSMKSLRIHFFNRHGIDLDNPGPGGTSSLLLALETQANQVAAAAAAAGFVPGLAAAAAAVASAGAGVAGSMPPSHQSDSGESLRSLENVTPPMHFLTPHVEISTLSDNGSSSELFNGNPANGGSGSGSDSMDTTSKCKEQLQPRESARASPALAQQLSASSSSSAVASGAGLQPPQDQPMDCNTKTLPSSTSSCMVSAQLNASSRSHHHQHHHENHITPSISLIPIKQELPCEDLSSDKHSQKAMGLNGEQLNDGDSGEDFSSPNSRLTSLIKVSPLKSLLREDLKRRICAKANNRITRNAAALENNNVLPAPGAGVVGGSGGGSTPNSSSTCNSTPICNGTITSTGQDADATLLSRKQILTCLFCGIEFPDETLYFLHKGCHCESNPWKCNICGEQCNNVYEFNSHLLSKSHQ